MIDVPDELVIYNAYLYVYDDGFVGFIIPVIVSSYTLPNVRSSRNGILSLIPKTEHELI